MTLISTIIPTYNQERFIDKAIQSAVEQVGDFAHEIIVSSDGSTDQTRERVQDWQRRYPLLVQDLSTDDNGGISANFRRLFHAAKGKYIAILEGDDLWIDPLKLEKQKNFLEENIDCSMVFSLIRVRQLPSGEDCFLERQARLTKNKLWGEDFLEDGSMNLIANFSSCMLPTCLAKCFPDVMFRERFNEIAMAFFLERTGAIGFIKEEMSIYHQHAAGVWTGLSQIAQLQAGLSVREVVLDVAHPRHAAAITSIIEERYRLPLEKMQS